jgi:hypothetical protein
MTVDIRREMIGPRLAEAYLEKNIGNRKPSMASINKYARDMLAGKWTETGDTIKFDVNDVLIDGQNRLKAVVACGVQQDFFVARGLSTDAKMATDIGIPRSVSHMLDFMGEKNVAAMASTARLCLAHRRGSLGKSGTNATSSVREVIDFVEENPSLRECVSFTNSDNALRSLLTPSVIGFMRYITLRIDRNKSDLFFQHLSLPPADKTHPCYVLSSSVSRMRAQSRRGENISYVLVLALTIKAWNVFYEDRKVQHFKWADKSQFPEISGYVPDI